MKETYEHLVEGQRYRVARAFVDFDGRRHEEGETWTFVGHNYLPYDCGHTFHIREADGGERSFRMQGYPEEQGPILDQIRTYLVLADD